MEKISKLFILLVVCSLTNFCVTAQAQYDIATEPLPHEEIPYGEEDTIPAENDMQFPAEEPTFNEEDLLPDTIDPGQEISDELIRDMQNNDTMPTFDDSPGDVPDSLPPPAEIDQMPAEEPGFEIGTDMMPDSSKPGSSSEQLAPLPDQEL